MTTNVLFFKLPYKILYTKRPLTNAPNECIYNIVKYCKCYFKRFSVMENKFWTFFSVALACMAFLTGKVPVFVLLLIGASIMVMCALFSYFWGKISASHNKWIDYLYYVFSKNKLDYTVLCKSVEYEIDTRSTAKYKVECDLKSKVKSADFCYKGRYNWEQDEDIDVAVTKGFVYRCNEDLKWSEVSISPVKKFVHRKERLEVGFYLNNLRIRKLSKHSFLSCKVIEKIEFLQLKAIVHKSLSPEDKAVFIVQDNFGEEVSREEVAYDIQTSSFKKTVKYPRRGRKYIIKWDYKN